MTQLTIRLFGYPQFLIDNVPIKVERRKTLALAIYLAVETGLKRSANPGRWQAINGSGQKAYQCIGRETLSALFWPDYPAEKAGSYLRQALWDFSKAAGEEWLIKDSQAVGFNLDAPVGIDVNTFREIYTRQVSGLHQQAASTSTLIHLSELYREDFLTGFTLADSPAFDDWQSLHTESLRLQLTLILEELVDRLSAQRQFDQGIQYALR
jgi:DNA-binding SARP family transcriptional activator